MAYYQTSTIFRCYCVLHFTAARHHSSGSGQNYKVTINLKTRRLLAQHWLKYSFKIFSRQHRKDARSSWVVPTEYLFAPISLTAAEALCWGKHCSAATGQQCCFPDNSRSAAFRIFSYSRTPLASSSSIRIVAFLTFNPSPSLQQQNDRLD